MGKLAISTLCFTLFLLARLCFSNPDILPARFDLSTSKPVIYNGNPYWQGATGTPLALFGVLGNLEVHGLLYKGKTTNEQIYFSYSSDGVVYTNEVLLYGVNTADPGVAAAIFNGQLFVVWIYPGGPRSTNLAIFNPMSCTLTCNPVFMLPSFGPLALYTPTLLSSSSTLSLLWKQSTGSGTAIYYSTYNVANKQFSGTSLLTNQQVESKGMIGASYVQDNLILLAYRRVDSGELDYTYSTSTLSNAVTSMYTCSSNWISSTYNQVSIVHWGFEGNSDTADFAIYAANENPNSQLAYIYYNETSLTWSNSKFIYTPSGDIISTVTSPSAVVGFKNKLYIYWLVGQSSSTPTINVGIQEVQA